MKERPILFSAPMVRALLEGRKTVTRRIFAPERMTWTPNGRYQTHALRNGEVVQTGSGPFKPECWLNYCPHGQPGDRLWVREAWRSAAGLDDLSGKQIAERCKEAGYRLPWAPIQYEASGFRNEHWSGFGDPHGSAMVGRYRHARFMPRWASRITLEVTNVRVERLCEGEGDTSFESRYLAEGINSIHHGDGDYYYSAIRDEPHPKNWSYPDNAFRELWESINGIGSWNTDPWVWAIEFRRLASA
ncbi:hypothetical protein [Rhodanobacter sp. BL-MT-08]